MVPPFSVSEEPPATRIFPALLSNPAPPLSLTLIRIPPAASASTVPWLTTLSATPYWGALKVPRPPPPSTV